MTPDELFQRHPLPWRLASETYALDQPCKIVVDANGEISADLFQMDTIVALSERAALAERAVALLERIAMQSRLPMAREVTEFLADARRVLGKEGT